MAEGLELREASKNLSAATAELTRFNQRAGVEIAKTIGADLKKGVLDPFTSQFAALPGVATLGAVGKTLFNKAFAAIKEKREQNLLRQRLGLTKDQFNQMKYQKKVLDAQAEYADQLKSGAESLLGLDTDQFNIAAGMFVDDKNRFTMGINRFAKEQGELVALTQAKMDKDDKAASARVEKDNRDQRETDYQNSLFAKIADSITGLSEGLANFKPEESGMGLLAPLGIIGGIISAFVGGFVKSIKDQITAIKLVTGGAFKKFLAVGDDIAKLIKGFIPEGIKTFFSAEGKFATAIRNVTTRIKSAFTIDIEKLPKFNLGIVDKLTSVATRIGNFFAENKFFKAIGETVGKFTRGLKSIGTSLSGFFSSIKGAVTGVAGMTGEAGVIGKIMGFARAFGATLGKLFLPITIVISAFDLITGFVDGFKESKGDNIVSRFIDGGGGGLSKMIGNLVGVPLDLLKKGVGMILGFLGFDDAKKSLESFSFKDLIMKIVKAPYNLISKAIDYIVGVFTGENNVVEDLISGVANVAEAAKGLLKGILRSILPSPKNEDGGVMGWIKSQVSSVIPDKVYEFAGLDPETGERILPKPTEENIQALTDAGLLMDFKRNANVGNAEEMERLIREAEMFKQGGGGTTVNNVNNYTTTTDSRSTTFTQQNLQDPALATGSAM